MPESELRELQLFMKIVKFTVKSLKEQSKQ